MTNPSYPQGEQPPTPWAAGPDQPPPQQPPWSAGRPPSQQGYGQQPYQEGYGQPPYGQAYSQAYTRQTGDPGTLDLPWYGIGFGQAIARAFRKYVRFDGRASRGEFWWFALFDFVVCSLLSIPAWIVLLHEAPYYSDPSARWKSDLAAAPLELWALAILLPMLGLYWRRLHDTGRSGAFALLGFVPFVGLIVVLILCALDSSPQGQQYDRRPQTPGSSGPSGTAGLGQNQPGTGYGGPRY